MRIEADVKRSVDPLLFAVKTDRLGYREDMRLVEGVVERAAAMPGGSEHDPLRGDGWIWSPCVIGGHQLGNIDENRRFRKCSCHWTHFHVRLLRYPTNSLLHSAGL